MLWVGPPEKQRQELGAGETREQEKPLQEVVMGQVQGPAHRGKAPERWGGYALLMRFRRLCCWWVSPLDVGTCESRVVEGLELGGGW